jgi:hypothetical protein
MRALRVSLPMAQPALVPAAAPGARDRAAFPDVRGDGVVVDQRPAAGAAVVPGATAVAWLARAAPAPPADGAGP